MAYSVQKSTVAKVAVVTLAMLLAATRVSNKK